VVLCKGLLQQMGMPSTGRKNMTGMLVEFMECGSADLMILYLFYNKKMSK